ncbi:MAG: GAF domain-containing protein, partial [Ardenticatenaceae bacterium]
MKNSQFLDSRLKRPATAEGNRMSLIKPNHRLPLPLSPSSVGSVHVPAYSRSFTPYPALPKEHATVLKLMYEGLSEVAQATDVLHVLQLITNFAQGNGWYKAVATLRESTHFQITHMASAGLTDEEHDTYLHAQDGALWWMRLGAEFERFRHDDWYYIPFAKPEYQNGQKATSHPQDLLYLPIRSNPNDDPIGVLILCEPVDRHAPNVEKMRAIQIFCKSAALMLEKQRLSLESTRHLTATRVVQETATLVTSSHAFHVEDIIRHLAHELVVNFDYLMVAIYLREGERFVMVECAGALLEELDYGASAPMCGVIGQAIKNQRTCWPAKDVVSERCPELVERRQAQEPGSEKPWPLRIANELAVPMVRKAEVLGVMHVKCTSKRPLTLKDKELLETLSEQLTTAIANVQRFSQTQRHTLQLKTASEVSSRVTSILNIDQLLAEVVNLIQRNFAYYQVQIFLHDPDSNNWVMREGSGQATVLMKEVGYRYGNEEGIVGEVGVTGMSILVTDVSQEPRHLFNPYLPDTKAELAVPLRLGAQVLGVLHVQSNQIGGVSSSDQAIMETLANQVAVALKNAQLFSKIQAQLAEQEMLYCASSAISGAQNVQEVLEALMEPLAVPHLVRAALLIPASNPSTRRKEELEVAAIWNAPSRELEATEPLALARGAKGANGSEGGFGLDTLRIARKDSLKDGQPRGIAPTINQGRFGLGTLQIASKDGQPRGIAPTIDQGGFGLGTLQIASKDGQPRGIAPTINQGRIASKEGQPRGIAPTWGVAGMGFGAESMPALHRLATQAQDQVEIINHVVEEERFEPVTQTLIEQLGILSLAVVPLHIPRHQQGVVGWLLLMSRREGGLNADLLRPYQALADQAALAMTRLQLLSQTQQRAMRLEALNTLSTNITASLDLDKTLNDSVETMAHLFRVQQSGLLLFEQNHNTYGRLVAQYREDGYQHAEEILVPLVGNPLIDQMLTTREPIYIRDVNTDPLAVVIREGKHPRSYTALLIVPLLIRDRVIGSISLDVVKGAERHFEPEEIRLAQTMAAQIAAAIEKARLYKQATQHAHQMDSANQVGQHLTRMLNEETLVREVVRLIAKRFEFYQVSIYLRDRDYSSRLNLHAASGPLGRKRHHTHSLWKGQGLPGHVLKERQALVANEVIDDIRFQRHPLLPNTAAQAAIPLTLAGELLGVLDIHSTRAGTFQPDLMAALSTIADQIVIALQNARLFAAQQETVHRLQEVDRLKSEFLASMSHELRTPLNSIIGFAKIILRGIDGPLTDLQRQDLGAIYRSGQHLLALINDILDLSKIAAGRMELVRGALHITDVGEEVLQQVSPQAAEKSLRLESHYEENLPPVLADRVRVRQILLNLLSNAIKFTETGKIQLISRRVAHPWPGEGQKECVGDPRGKYIEIAVKDTGIGIKPEDEKILFEAFRQVGGSPSRRAGGTGLGLAIARRFAELHGTSLWVESRYGVGSTFRFTLPIMPEEKQHRRPRPRPALTP